METPRDTDDAGRGGRPEDLSGAFPEAEPRLSATTVRDRAAQGVVTLALRGLAIRLMGLVGTIVLARFLQPSEFGQIALGLTLVAATKVVVEGGLSVALVRRPEPVTRRELEVVSGFQLVTALTILAATMALAAPFGTIGLVAAIMALSLPLDTLRAPTYVQLERRLSYGFIARIELVEILVYNVAAIVGVVAGFGVYGVAGAVVVRSVIAAGMVAAGPVGLVSPGWDSKVVRSLLGFGLAFQGKNMVSLGRDQVLNVLIAAIAGTAALGFWSLTTRLLQPVIFVLESLWRVIYPAIARLLESGVEADRLLSRSLASISVAVGFAAVALAASSGALVQVLLGSEYSAVSRLLPWMAVGFVIGSPLYLCATGYLFARGRAKLILGVTVAKAVGGLAIAAILLPSIGVDAAVVAILVSGTGEAAYFAWILRREVGVPAISIAVVPVLATGAGTVVGLYTAQEVGQNFLGLAAASSAGAGVYAMAMLITRRDTVRELWALMSRGFRSSLGRQEEPQSAGGAPRRKSAGM